MLIGASSRLHNPARLPRGGYKMLRKMPHIEVQENATGTTFVFDGRNAIRFDAALDDLQIGTTTGKPFFLRSALVL